MEILPDGNVEWSIELQPHNIYSSTNPKDTMDKTVAAIQAVTEFIEKMNLNKRAPDARISEVTSHYAK